MVRIKLKDKQAKTLLAIVIAEIMHLSQEGNTNTNSLVELAGVIRAGILERGE